MHPAREEVHWLIEKQVLKKIKQKYFQKSLSVKKEVLLLHPLTEREAKRKNKTFIDILDWQPSRYDNETK